MKWRDGQASQPDTSLHAAERSVASEAESAAEEAPLDTRGEAGNAVSDSSAQDAADAGEAFDAQTYFATQHFSEDGTALYTPLIIGDSVTVACIDQFNAAFPYGLIDAEVSRNVWESPYATYRDQGTVGQVVIFCLGTNNAVVDWQIDDELLNMVEEEKTVFFVNTRSNQAWTESTNQTLADIPSRHANVAAIIDWYSYSQGHDE